MFVRPGTLAVFLVLTVGCSQLAVLRLSRSPSPGAVVARARLRLRRGPVGGHVGIAGVAEEARHEIQVLTSPP
jgi:hypothetical protein